MDGRFEELARTGRLPSPSGIGARVLKLTQDQDVTIDDISAAITHDPALTGRLLRVANSAAASGAVPLATAQEATMRLGLKAVSAIAVGFTLITNNREGDCPDFDYPAYWSRSMAIAVAAQVLCVHAAPEYAAEAFTAGLMLEIGQLAYASAEPEIYAGIQRLLIRGAGNLRDLETRNFGNDHFMLGSWLLGQWGMPDLFPLALRTAGNGRIDELDAITLDPAIATLAQTLVAALHLAKHHIGKAQPNWKTDKQLAELLDDLDINADVFEELMPTIDSAWRALAADLAFKPLPPLDLDEVSTAAGEEDPTGPLTLVMDSNTIARNIATNCLHRAGIAVATAESETEAIGIALGHQPAVLIVDWSPPDEGEQDTVLALCQALRRCEAGRKLFVLATCQHKYEEACQGAFDAEADDFLTKPFSPKDLIAKAQMGLRLSAAQDQIRHRRSSDKDPVNIDDIVAADDAINKNSGRCQLTGLPNKQYATSRLSNFLVSPIANVSVLGVIADGYASRTAEERQVINHELALFLGETLRRNDIVASVSPGQFILVCPGTDATGAKQLGHRLLAEASTYFGTRVHNAAALLTLSICIAERSTDSCDASALIARVAASIEMFAEDGGNHVFNAA